jgi:hypothetical protein
MKTIKRSQLQKAKSEDKSRAIVLVPSWELCIADAQERIGQLGRSIEMFKHNIKAGVPFPIDSQNGDSAS